MSGDNKRNEKGFTLIEVIAVMIILGVFAVSASMGFLGVIRGALFTQDNTIALNEVQEQLALLTIELSRACEMKSHSASVLIFDTQVGTEAAVSRTLNAPSGVTFSYDENKKTVTISMDVTMGDDQAKTFSTTIAPYKLVSKQGCI
jgi:prepilin-type N-terminal cleavage/methylation domain-containing protein